MIFSLTKKQYARIILSAISITLCSAALWFMFIQNRSDIHIYSFDKKRDMPFILDLFKDNMYWLYEGPASEFSPEYILETQSSSKRPEHYHNLIIKTLYKKDEPVGFVAYYTLSFYSAKLLFLAVRKEFRGQKYGYLLLQAAVDDMKSRGIKKIRLITRTNNESSQNLYKKFGFYQTDIENGIVTFDYDIP